MHINFHMAGSSQPQHFFTAGCLFTDFAAVIFYPIINTKPYLNAISKPKHFCNKLEFKKKIIFKLPTM